METPNIPSAGHRAEARPIFDIMSTSFFLSRRSVGAGPRSGMPTWQDRPSSFSPKPPTTRRAISNRRPTGFRSGRKSLYGPCRRQPAPVDQLTTGASQNGSLKTSSFRTCQIALTEKQPQPLEREVGRVAILGPDAHVSVVYGDMAPARSTPSPCYGDERWRSRNRAGDPRNSVAILWALILMLPSNMLILLRADNDGEGNAVLMALASRALGGKSVVIILLGIISAALFYGDALITPAISVVGGRRSLNCHALGSYVVPLTFLILFALFAVQSRGTAASPPSSARLPCLVHRPCRRSCAYRAKSRRARRLQSRSWPDVLG